MKLRIASLMALATAVHLPGLSAHVDAPAEPQCGTSRSVHVARGTMLGRRPPLPFGNCQPAPRNPYPKANAANHFDKPQARVQHFNSKDVEIYIDGEKFEDEKVFGT